MKRLLLFITLFISASVNADSATLIINTSNQSELPKSYRSTTLYDPNVIPSNISQEGLAALNISGSAQYSAAQFSYIKDVLPYLSVVFDLRQESHGFINGNAISWFVPKNWVNLGIPPFKIQKIENGLLENLLGQQTVALFNRVGAKDAPTYTLWKKLKPETTENERFLVQNEGVEYHRFYVPDDQPPTLGQIDRFVSIWENLPLGSHAHFHCEDGHGRTTTFMVLADILENAENVSLQDILTRQAAIGGKDLTTLPDPSNYTYPYVVERLELIKTFYNYVKNTNLPRPQFSHWVQK